MTAIKEGARQMSSRSPPRCGSCVALVARLAETAARCCSRARAAPARTWSPTGCTTAARGATGRHQGPLPVDSRRPAGVRAVRPRDGRLHRRAPDQGGQDRDGHRGTFYFDQIQDLALRCRPSSCAWSRSAVRARGRDADDRGRRAFRRLVERRSPPRPSRGPLPRGPVPPPERGAAEPGAAAHPPRGHPSAGRAVPHARARARHHGRRLRARDRGALRGYHWPGNVRELRSVIERAALYPPGSA